MDTLRSEETQLSYLSAGDHEAPLLLCLHGFPDTPRTWQRLLSPWAESGGRVVAPWLPGYTPSRLDGPLDFISVAERILMLAEELSPGRPIHLLGHDWGAVIVHAAASLYPSRLRSAIALSIPHPATIAAQFPKHPSQLARSSYMLFFQLRRLSDRALASRNFAMVDWLWGRWSPGFIPDPEHIAVVKRCLAQSLPGPLQYYRSMLSPAVVLRANPLLRARVQVPTLYLHGENDGCMPPEMADGQKAFFASEFEAQVLPRAGHVVHLEQSDRVRDLVLDWLGAHSV